MSRTSAAAMAMVDHKFEVNGRMGMGRERKIERGRERKGMKKIGESRQDPTLGLSGISTLAAVFPLLTSPPIMPRSAPSWLALLALLALVLPSNALYFYMDGRQTRCFFEELPKDTLVVGQLPDPPIPGQIQWCTQQC